MRLCEFLLLLYFVAGASASCGCLKCSKHLRVVSPAHAPLKIIYKDAPGCRNPKYIPYAIQHPAVQPLKTPCTLATVGYTLDHVGSLPGSIHKSCPRVYHHAYKVQKPVVTPSSCPELICGLVARPDRIVIPAVKKHYTQSEEETKVIFEPYESEEEAEDEDYILPVGYEAIRPAMYDRYLHEDTHYPLKSIKKRSINFDNLHKTNKNSDIISDEFNSLDSIERNLNKLGTDSLLNGHSKSLLTGNIFIPKNYNNKNRQQYRKELIRDAKSSSNNKKGISSVKKLLDDSKLLNNLKNTQISTDKINKNNCGVINIHNLHVYNNKKPDQKKPNPSSANKVSTFKSKLLKLAQQPFRLENFFKKESTSNKYQRLAIKKPQRTAKKKSKPKKSNTTQRSLWDDYINPQDDLEDAHFTTLNRQKRALFMNGDSFYKVTEDSNKEILDDENDNDIVNSLFARKNVDEDSSFDFVEDYNGNVEEIVQRGRKEVDGTINYDTILPRKPFVYFLNVPLKILNHFHDLATYFSPILQTVPSVFKKSTSYLNNFNDKIKRHARDFASNLIGDFEDEIDSDNTAAAKRPNARYKRELLKLIDEDELQEFLREKLSMYQDEKAVEINLPAKDTRKKFKIEKVAPKIIVDKSGKTFLDIDGIKSPILDVNKKILRLNKDRFVKPRGKISLQDTETIDDYNLQKSISEIIAQARSFVGHSKNVDVEQYDINRSRQSIKDKINDILVDIQQLIHADFAEDAKIFGPILDLQNRQKIIVDMWRKSLVNLKHNEISEKIKILSGLQEIEKVKAEIVADLIRILSTGRNYHSNQFIKILIRLQKLQCVLIKVVEEFGERIKLGTKFDVHNEIKYIETLNKIHFTNYQQISEIERELKKERDIKLEQDMKLIEQLRKMLEESTEDTIEEEAKLLWELKNIEKLQFNSLGEVKENIARGVSIRRELKIIFDLEKQREKCKMEQIDLLGKIVTVKKESDDKEKVALKHGKYKIKKKLPKKIFTTKKTGGKKTVK